MFTEGDYTGCDAIYSEWDGATLFGENLTVRHCTFDDTVDTAIQLEYAWYCDIHNNVFWDCDEFGIFVNPLGSGASYLNVHDNVFHAAGAMHAIDIQSAEMSVIERNTIFNADAAVGAASTDEGVVTTGGRLNMVCNNWFSCALPGGGAGDYDDLNTAAATDAWVHNMRMNGEATTNPT